MSAGSTVGPYVFLELKECVVVPGYDACIVVSDEGVRSLLEETYAASNPIICTTAPFVIGTVCTVYRMEKHPHVMKIFVRPTFVATLQKEENSYLAHATPIEVSVKNTQDAILQQHAEAVMDLVKEETLSQHFHIQYFPQKKHTFYITCKQSVFTGVFLSLPHIPFFLLAHSIIPFSDKLAILTESCLEKQYEMTVIALSALKKTVESMRKMDDRVKEKHKEYMRQLYKNFFENEFEEGEAHTLSKDLKNLQEKINTLPEGAVRKHAQDEYAKMMANQSSQDASMRLEYLQYMVSLPWNVKKAVRYDLTSFETELEKSHSGMKNVKEKFINYMIEAKHRHLFMQDEKKNARNSKVLCLVGPPGVGKTSIIEELASIMGIDYQSIALGGVGDEAHIRGHRRTYVGAQPGRFIKAIHDAGSNNPLILLDEIDKLGSNGRGDPASALLEILDPVQNNNFKDNYLEVPFSFSECLFVCTANSLSSIPIALQNRMDVVMISSYTLQEKINIAKRHFLPSFFQQYGVNFSLSDDALISLIQYYTNEAGVRDLKRKIQTLVSIALKKVYENVEEKIKISYIPETKNTQNDNVISIKKRTVPKKNRVPVERVAHDKNSATYKAQYEALLREEIKHFSFHVDTENIATYLGLPLSDSDQYKEQKIRGRVMGLAFTEYGGRTLPIETLVVKGKGKSIATGSLGTVMKESVEVALRYAASILTRTNFHEYDVHVHAPSGAISKEGPSAGVAIFIAIMSEILHVELSSSIGITGEIDLHGNALKIGGVKEKALAAVNAGITTILLPSANQPCMAEVLREYADVFASVRVVYYSTALEALRVFIPHYDMLFARYKKQKLSA